MKIKNESAVNKNRRGLATKYELYNKVFDCVGIEKIEILQQIVSFLSIQINIFISLLHLYFCFRMLTKYN